LRPSIQKGFMIELYTLFKKELVTEWRQRYALNGILLYVVSTVFVCYLSFNLQQGKLSVITWNVLFWIINLFTAVNAIAKSFFQEQYGRQFYYYSIASPQGIIFAKILYNGILMVGLTASSYFFYSVVMGNPVQDNLLFMGNLLLAAIGFSSALTMVSGIAAKASNNVTLMAVLSFPIILPMLIMLIKVSKNAIDGLTRSSSYQEIGTLLAIDVIVIALSYLLFPYLWRS
jgi:heme exporter protein B